MNMVQMFLTREKGGGGGEGGGINCSAKGCSSIVHSLKYSPTKNVNFTQRNV